MGYSICVKNNGVLSKSQLDLMKRVFGYYYFNMDSTVEKKLIQITTQIEHMNELVKKASEVSDE